MGKLFSGSKTEKTTNGAFPQLKSSLTPVIDPGLSGLTSMKALLGGDSSGFDAYKKATGFDATAEMGSRGITGNQAAKGLLRSGSTGMALQNYGQTLQNQYADDYMQGNQGIFTGGLNAATLLGQTASKKTTASKKPGLVDFGRAAAAFAGGG